MSNSATDTGLTVSTDGTAGPYVIVTPEQIRPVTEALRAEGVPFRVNGEAVFLDGLPALTMIDLGAGADVGHVQQVLDRVSSGEQARRTRRAGSTGPRQLGVWGDGPAMRQLKQRFDGPLTGGWDRRPEIEARFATTLPSGASGYCFSKTVPTIDCRPVAVLLRGRSTGSGDELSVSAVVPTKRRERLSPDEHDLIVADFRDTLIKPLARGLSVRLLDGRPRVEHGLEALLSVAALERLQSFSAAADMAQLNRPDLQRWAEFIGQAHRDDAVIDPDQLGAWLEEEGFPQEQRERLVHEYEAGRRLLGTYDAERA